MIGTLGRHFRVQVTNSKFQTKIAAIACVSDELSDEELEVVQRDKVAELRVKFQVHGMRGQLAKINPIIADGKAKKLATAKLEDDSISRFLVIIFGWDNHHFFDMG